MVRSRSQSVLRMYVMQAKADKVMMKCINICIEKLVIKVENFSSLFEEEKKKQMSGIICHRFHLSYATLWSSSLSGGQ